MRNKICRDCQQGEHDNYDEDIKLVYVREADTKKIIRRCYMCETHQEMYCQDGYEVKIIK